MGTPSPWTRTYSDSSLTHSDSTRDMLTRLGLNFGTRTGLGKLRSWRFGSSSPDQQRWNTWKRNDHIGLLLTRHGYFKVTEIWTYFADIVPMLREASEMRIYCKVCCLGYVPLRYVLAKYWNVSSVWKMPCTRAGKFPLFGILIRATNTSHGLGLGLVTCWTQTRVRSPAQ